MIQEHAMSFFNNHMQVDWCQHVLLPPDASLEFAGLQFFTLYYYGLHFWCRSTLSIFSDLLSVKLMPSTSYCSSLVHHVRFIPVPFAGVFLKHHQVWKILQTNIWHWTSNWASQFHALDVSAALAYQLFGHIWSRALFSFWTRPMVSGSSYIMTSIATRILFVWLATHFSKISKTVLVKLSAERWVNNMDIRSKCRTSIQLNERFIWGTSHRETFAKLRSPPNFQIPRTLVGVCDFPFARATERFLLHQFFLLLSFFSI